MSYLKKCYKHNLITPPLHVVNQLQYEVIIGSHAYGVSSDTSDIDVYGFSIPNRNIVFPHENKNYIHGFDPVPNNFEQFQQHHIKFKDGKKEFDFCIYNIIKYFKLCANGNPNMIDSLFVPRRCITHSTNIGELVRENRHIFLSKKCWHTFKGYAYSQLHKMNIKKPDPNGKRYKSILKYGYDIKYAYHLIRLLNEIEQILTEGDLDLEKNRQQLKYIRKGGYSEKEIVELAQHLEKHLESINANSKEVPHKMQTEKIRNLLWRCLELHFQDDIKPKHQDIYIKALKEIQDKIAITIK